MIPKRIQRKRTKGWRMPENTVYVGRGSKWGNPFKIVGKKIYIQRFHRPEYILYDNIERENVKEFVIAKFKSFIRHNARYKGKYNLEELRGKNLACWCKEGEPCHADVLLKLANK